MLSENYSVCLNDDGSPRQVGHNGPVVTYKAIGFDSGRPVAMQLIPLSSLSEGERVRFEESAREAHKLEHPNITRVVDIGTKDEHLVFVSEYVEGETAEEWIDEHGPMPPDAVLRIGFQIANALAAGAEHGVRHHTIQPSNVLILPGVAADGGWPGIKLLDFGLPSVKLNSDGDETRELIPSMAPEFASPEQRQNTIVDVRSDIFSLGATMWFLLTGNAPPAAGPTDPAPRLSAKTADIPRFVRNLVSRMLRSNVEERPQDAGALAERMRACLQKAERRTAFTRSFTPAAIPGPAKIEKRSVAPALALAAAVIALAAVAAFFLPDRFLHREPKPLGVLIGVPETVSQASVSESPAMPVAANEKTEAGSLPSPSGTEHSGSAAQQSVSAARPSATGDANSVNPPANKSAGPPQVAANNQMAEPSVPSEGPSSMSQAPGSTALHSDSKPVTTTNSPAGATTASPDLTKDSPSPQVVANNRMAEPPVPTEGPLSQASIDTETSSSGEKTEQPELSDQSAVAAEESAATTPGPADDPAKLNFVKKDETSTASKTKTKTRRQRSAKSSVARAHPPLRVGANSARLVRVTPKGNWIVRLSSGQTVIASPGSNLDDAPIVTPRAIRRVERPMPYGEDPVLVAPPDF